MYEELVSNGYDQLKLIGVGKSQHLNWLDNWINGNDAPVCADQSGFAGYATWNQWEASQRDLFVLDHAGNVVFHEDVTGGLPSNLESLIIGLVTEIPSDCNPDLMCGEAETCCDGLLYPTTCCSENCDEPIGECGECEDGEFDNSNPCNPWECWGGQWYEIIIDCAEQMGVPCDGGVYVAPPDEVCCSTCVQYGDNNGDGILNVLDVVAMVNLALSSEYEEIVDMNGDGTINVLDIVLLVGVILG